MALHAWRGIRDHSAFDHLSVIHHTLPESGSTRDRSACCRHNSLYRVWVHPCDDAGFRGHLNWCGHRLSSPCMRTSGIEPLVQAHHHANLAHDSTGSHHHSDRLWSHVIFRLPGPVTTWAFRDCRPLNGGGDHTVDSSGPRPFEGEKTLAMDYVAPISSSCTSRLIMIVPVSMVLSLAYLGWSEKPFWEMDIAKLSPIPQTLRDRDTWLRQELGTPTIRDIMVVVAPDEQHGAGTE